MKNRDVENATARGLSHRKLRKPKIVGRARESDRVAHLAFLRGRSAPSTASTPVHQRRWGRSAASTCPCMDVSAWVCVSTHAMGTHAQTPRRVHLSSGLALSAPRVGAGAQVLCRSVRSCAGVLVDSTVSCRVCGGGQAVESAMVTDADTHADTRRHTHARRRGRAEVRRRAEDNTRHTETKDTHTSTAGEVEEDAFTHCVSLRRSTLTRAPPTRSSRPAG